MSYNDRGGSRESPNNKRYNGRGTTVRELAQLCMDESEIARNIDSYLVDLVRTEALRMRGLLDDETTHMRYLELLATEVLPAASTIYAARRRIQAQGLFPPTDPAVSARREAASRAHKQRRERKLAGGR